MLLLKMEAGRFGGWTEGEHSRKTIFQYLLQAGSHSLPLVT